jgi:hypothetical protein
MDSAMLQTAGPLVVSLAFLAVNVLVLLSILELNRRNEPTPPGDGVTHDAAQGARLETASGLPLQESDGVAHDIAQVAKVLPESDILRWEFTYARVTASEAMSERHTMVNFYLLVAGIVTTGVVTILGKDTGLPKQVGAIMLWLVCCIGWIYFLAIIRLRQAWYESAKEMNQIKMFYFEHAKEMDGAELQKAFRWLPDTLPKPEKMWTVYFYSAMLISFLNSAAFVAGGGVLALSDNLAAFWGTLAILVLCGLAYFGFHVWLYEAFLKPRPKQAAESPK